MSGLLSRTLCCLIVLAMLLIATGWGHLCAQEIAPSEQPAKQSAPSLPPDSVSSPTSERPLPVFPELSPRVGDRLFLLGPDGKFEFIPAEVNIEDFLEWKRKQFAPPRVPDYSFSDVTLEGTALENEAVLTAKLTIQITPDKEWVRVPLELHEGVLRKFQHEYQPQAPAGNANRGKAGFDRFDRKSGFHWWFQGQGQHVLTLEMNVPIKKSSGTRRLQLAVPSAASSYLRLKIPVPQEQLNFDAILAGANKTTAFDAVSTQVELFRLEQRVDLGWRTLPDARQVKTLLKAASEIRIEPTEESILLRAKQLIEPLQGSLKEIEVSLPGGFTVLELRVDGEVHQLSKDLPQAPEPIKITLPAATTNRVRLDWVLQTPWPTSGQLAVEGLNVADCLSQSGDVAIAEFEGYRIVKRSGDKVYRTNPRELLGPGPIQTAFQFREQPFQILLDLLPIQPTYSVRPHLFLKMGETQIELLADLEVDVYRGVVDRLELDWPQFEEQGWTIDRTELPGLVEDMELDSESGRIAFLLAKRLGQGSRFQFPLKATRKIDSESATSIPITLPRVIASNPVRAVVVVTNDDSVESTLLPVAGTESQPLSASFAEEVESLLNQPAMSDFRRPQHTGFLIRSDQQSFQARIVTHPPSIESQTQLFVAVEDDKIHVTQQLHYDVKYEQVAQLRVMVPNTFPEPIQFTLDEVPLKYEWTGVALGDSRQARLTLPKPKLSEFEIVAAYTLPRNRGEEHRLILPCLRASDASRVSGRLIVNADQASQVAVEDPQWIRSSELAAGNAWTTAQVGDAVQVAWTSRQPSDRQSFRVRSALVRSAVLKNGRRVSQASYVLDRSVDHVLIALPPEVMLPDAFHWQGVELSESQVTLVEPDTGTYRLMLPTSVRTDNSRFSGSKVDDSRLSVTYHETKVAPLNWSQTIQISTPSFPGHVGVERTQWEIALPVDQHLLTLPEGFTPEFSWSWQGLWWARTPNLTSGENGSDPSAQDFPLEGNLYRFGYYGPVSELSFTAMNRSMIVLFGAGLALLLGFLLLKVAFTRNVLTVLCVIFLFALASVWFMEPIQVLLQPAALGLLLAIAAVLLDGNLKQHRQAHALPLSEPEDHSGSSLGRAPRGYADPIGSEDPTAVRPGSEAPGDSQATQQRNLRAEHSTPTPPALIGSSLVEKSE